ncbi:hypothetical protein GCM10011505_26590 [Tistrella bauzanensis]|uniref:Aminoglycoside phosphotransferase domain-containing protein n=1 Tax=Tistrella bauzanensis TaxID=657419 RepID=A0ABQ1IIX1_9PROT|nr:hypothetical protein [Tistrella bauzanensis]GGB43964.1 hypothetical protein GCM10011505_26590 [Tistrella bauzanensis]
MTTAIATETQIAGTPTALARDLARAGRIAEAEAVIAGLVAEVAGFVPARVAINRDGYSLNSVNGFIDAEDGRAFFFKFHQEEDEAETVGEYYRAELLAEAGFPVDRPIVACGEVGRQILIYARRDQPRLADLARAVEAADAGLAGPAPVTAERLIAAQAATDRIVAARYLAGLHDITAEEAAAEPLHRLFHDRLVDRDAPDRAGGRMARFYDGRIFHLGGRAAAPDLTLSWYQMRDLRWTVGGVTYDRPLGALFDEARARLVPSRFAGAGVTAHGDAHNANVWFEAGAGEGGVADRLSFFDPAFAGRHVPALLAEVKATFHNIFAHPFWLYDAALAETLYGVRAELDADGRGIIIAHDHRLSDLRQGFLDAKRDHLWRPLLRALADRGALDDDWRRVVKLALFCCPTLVMNLRAGPDAGGAGGGHHGPAASAIGLGIAIAMGAEPVAGQSDALSTMLDAVTP